LPVWSALSKRDKISVSRKIANSFAGGNHLRFLVTGGAGFIGSRIATRLLEDGGDVRILDNFATGKPENISAIRDKLEFIEGDIQDPDALKSAVDDVDVVFHEAAIASVPRSVDNPAEANSVNSTGTLNVLIAARDAGVRRVVYAASSAAYGDDPKLPKTEDMTPDPLSPYAFSKLAGEYYCKIFAGVYGLETVSLRYFNVFGPHQDPKSQYAAAIPGFIVPMLEGRSPTIYGDGEQTRDFVYVDNVVQANILAATVNVPSGQVFNVAGGERFSLNAVLGMLEDIMGRPSNAYYAPGRPGDVRHSVASIEKARRYLGFEPSISLKEGLARTSAWFAGSLGLPV
jgi:UDP-glucose 4-epimerase